MRASSVPSAAPVTPMWQAKMKTALAEMLTMFITSDTSMDTLALPMAWNTD